jgi:hypothetical protein
MRGRGWRALPLLAVAGCFGVAVLLPASAPARTNPCAEFFEAASSSPIAETSPLDPAVTAMFAVLRRPAGPEDQIPLFNNLSEDIGYQLRSYLPAYIRQLARDPDGDRYFVIAGFPRGSEVPPAKCLPARVRRLRARLVEEERKRAQTPVYCIEKVSLRNPGYGLSLCRPFAAVQSGSRLIEPDKSTSDVVELAPDGVASVRLSFVRGNVVSAPVANNAYSFTPPQRLVRDVQRRLAPLRRRLLQEFRHHHHPAPPFRRILKREIAIRDELRPRTVEWIAATGQVVRSFRPKPEGAAQPLGIFLPEVISAGG